ncbi:solute carrier family 22 member 16 [Aplysia californica]|uniref:Solute carrier family 22 member 16 n=1 Tax=Aplysia californica TaxID=6500 RepID=A0ABM1AAL2_APLCA|nr:solute carrier family 22 member 16 [Aplysia californica]
MADENSHVDAVLIALGATGKYQMMQMVVAVIAKMAAAFQLLSNVFISAEVDHHCAPPPNGTDISRRFQNYSHVNVTYGTCSIDFWYNGTRVAQEGCIYGMVYDQPVDTSAVSQFDLVCERDSLAKLSQTLVIAGQGIGAVLTTIASDRLGRKMVLIGSNIGLMLCGLAIAYAPNYIVFATFKFIVGGFQQGVVAGVFTYNSELFPSQQRRLNVMSGILAWALSAMLISPVAYLCRRFSWRTTQMVYSTVSVNAILQIWLLDESLRWLLANGKTEQAIKVIKRAARINRKDYDDVMSVFYKAAASAQTSKHNMEDDLKKTMQEDTAEKLTLLDLLRVKRLFINSVAIWFAWFTTALGFFALYLTSTSLSGNKYINFFLTSCMELPSLILFSVGLNRFGRRPTTALTFVLLSGGLLVRGILRSLDDTSVINVFILISSLVAMIGASGSFNGLFAYTPEIFPTNMRSQALGVSSFVGRIGGMLAPFTSVLADQVKWGPGVLIGGCAFIVCLLFVILPETNGRELPQTVGDLLKWYKPDDKTTDAEKGKGENPEEKYQVQGSSTQ